jgi:hypothetical protein
MTTFQCDCDIGLCSGRANCRNAPYLQPPLLGPIPPPARSPSPRVLPVNLPISNFGVTIAILDGDGNLTIKIDQPRPEATT